jgi:hypothetical protein
MTDTARWYQAGYRDPATADWVFGVSDMDTDLGYYDVELEVWYVGVPDILSGAWMPQDAVLTTSEQRDCPPENPIKGNLPSRIFHRPDQPTYKRTIPEICFASEAAAMAAGFRAAREGDTASEDWFGPAILSISGEHENHSGGRTPHQSRQLSCQYPVRDNERCPRLRRYRSAWRAHGGLFGGVARQTAEVATGTEGD